MHIIKFKNDTNNNIDSATVKKKIKESNENFSKKFNNLGEKRTNFLEDYKPTKQLRGDR